MKCLRTNENAWLTDCTHQNPVFEDNRPTRKENDLPAVSLNHRILVHTDATGLMSIRIENTPQNMFFSFSSEYTDLKGIYIDSAVFFISTPCESNIFPKPSSFDLRIEMTPKRF